MTVKFSNHVAFLQMRIFRGRSGDDFVNNDFARGRGLGRLWDPHLNAEIAADDPAFLQQTFQRVADGVRRNGKTDPLRTAAPRNDRCVNADDFTAEVNERPTTVARVDRGARLDQIAE